MKNKSNYNKFLLLWTGELISSIGGGLTSFGLGVYVFAQTGSAASMSLVTLLAFLPTLLLSAPAGVLADRYDRRLLMMIGDGCSGIGILFILLCMLWGEAGIVEICIGVAVSSVFSALLEPSYRATVTDLLNEEEYSKASGMVNIAGSAKFLISPFLAGLLLTVSDIKLLLFIDICTFFVTVIATGIVRKGLSVKQAEQKEAFTTAFLEGWKAITKKKGIFILILVSSLMTCFMGTFQILVQPMILAFTDSTTLGVAETICATGMLVSSLILGIRGLKKNYVKVLSLSLLLSGLAMSFVSLWEDELLICIAGFCFFAMLPFANNCLDYLVRTNIPDELQGRTWGLIGFLSQIGYVIAYVFTGILADKIGEILGIGVGRGAALVIMISGVLLAITALILYSIKSVRRLEK